VSRHQQLTSRG